jgi:amino acid transporter
VQFPTFGGIDKKCEAQMGDSSAPQSEIRRETNELLHGLAARKHRTKLQILPLVALIFYEVSGGPFGVEDAVKAGGPLLALLGFIIFPFIWSVPEALVTAELATAFPENGGYVLWISAAFGPFWGFQEGWCKWISGVTDNALYPVLFLDYFKLALPVFGHGVFRIIALLVITLSLTFLNYRGLTIVGTTAVVLTIFSLLPFCVLSLLAIPKIRVRRWLVVDFRKTDWRTYLNTLFWNLNYWDSVSTLAGEVDNPSKTFPKALLWAVLLVIVAYVVPLAAGTGALPLDRDKWDDGYLADVGMAVGGIVLKWWIESAAAFSNMGLFEAEMSSDSFQLLGMAETGMLPKIFAIRSKYGTPTLGILFSASGVLLLSWMSFQEIVEFLNFLYCFGMLLEFAAFIWLRMKKPELVRPFRIPVGTIGVILLLLPATVLLIVVMCIASWQTVVISIAVSVLGFITYPALQHVKAKKWMRFLDVDEPKVPEDDDTDPALSLDPVISPDPAISLHPEVGETEIISLTE